MHAHQSPVLKLNYLYPVGFVKGLTKPDTMRNIKSANNEEFKTFKSGNSRITTQLK